MTRWPAVVVTTHARCAEAPAILAHSVQATAARRFGLAQRRRRRWQAAYEPLQRRSGERESGDCERCRTHWGRSRSAGALPGERSDFPPWRSAEKNLMAPLPVLAACEATSTKAYLPSSLMVLSPGAPRSDRKRWLDSRRVVPVLPSSTALLLHQHAVEERQQ